MSSRLPMPVETLSYAPVARDLWMPLPNSVGVLGAVCAAMLLLSSLVSLVAELVEKSWPPGAFVSWTLGPVSLETLLVAAMQVLRAVGAALMLVGAIQLRRRAGGRQMFAIGLILQACGLGLITMTQLVMCWDVYASAGPPVIGHVAAGVLGTTGQVLVLVLLIVVLRPNQPAA